MSIYRSLDTVPECGELNAIRQGILEQRRNAKQIRLTQHYEDIIATAIDSYAYNPDEKDHKLHQRLPIEVDHLRIVKPITDKLEAKGYKISYKIIKYNFQGPETWDTIDPNDCSITDRCKHVYCDIDEP
jgi:hypothetical protein